MTEGPATTPSPQPPPPSDTETAPPLTPPLEVTAGRSGTQTPSVTGKHAAEPSVGQLVSDATAAVSVLVRSEIELAKLELRTSVKNAGTGAGLFVGALVVLVFSLTFGFFALAEGLAAAGLDRWLAFLVVFVFLVLVAGLFVFIGIRKIKAVRAPERTIKTTKDTVDYLKTHKPSTG